MAADLSKLWFLHEFIRKPKEFIHPKSTKTCGMPLAQALGELQNSAAFPRASHVASGLTFLSTGPWDKATNSSIFLLQLASRPPPCLHCAAGSPDHSCPSTVPHSPKDSCEDLSTVQCLNWTKRNAVHSQRCLRLWMGGCHQVSKRDQVLLAWAFTLVFFLAVWRGGGLLVQFGVLFS